jgi:uncharacterized protein
MSTAVTPQPSASISAVAPAWHTAAVVLILVGISGLSYYARGLPSVGHHHNRVWGYATTMLMEWLVFAFIWFGLRLRKQRLQILLGEKWEGSRKLVRDLALAIGFLITANVILSALGHLLKATTNAAIRSLLPHGPAEIAVYFLLTVTAGICEEMIFRGYLQRQFAAWSKTAAVGVLLQGTIFGASHGYQGPKLMLIIVVYGVLFGVLVQWRRSLRPGMIAHFLQDFVEGVLAGHYLK